MNLKIIYSIVLIIFPLGSLFFLSCSSTTESFTAPVVVTTTNIRDNGYADNRIFDLGLPEFTYTDSTGSHFYEQELIAGDSIVTLFIFEQETDRANQDFSIPANLNVKPVDPGRFESEDFEPIYGVKQLAYVEQFIWEQDIQNGKYHVVFNSRRIDSRALGIYMEVQRGSSIITFGKITNTDTLNLKLIKSHAPLPSYATWGLMWRNVYDLRQRGVPMDRLNIKVFKGLKGREGDSTSLDYQEFNGDTQSYIEILGLDQYSLGKKTPNGKVDDRPNIWRSDWGLLIFPSRTPFNTDTVFVNEVADTTQLLQDRIPSLYYYISRTHRVEASRYFLQILTTSRN